MKVFPAALVSLFLTTNGSAQSGLKISPDTVVLSSTEAQSIKVVASTSTNVPLPYTVAGKPAWLAITSASQFKAPDTLYFQVVNSVCGRCEAVVTLTPEGGSAAVPLTVRYTRSTVLAELIVSSARVTLSGTQSRSITVNAPGGGAVAYSVANAPPWLAVSSARNFRTPDTLYFQIANANCGACTAALSVVPAGGADGTPVSVIYDINAASSYRTTPTHVTLAYPAGAGGLCGNGLQSGCIVGINSTSPSINRYSAKITSMSDNWLMINNAPGAAANVPVAMGLNLAVNPAAAAAMATGAYSGQVVIYNPANQSDLVRLNVSLLLNPGKAAVSPNSGTGHSATFTFQFPHPAGWQNLSMLDVLINTSIEPKNACYLAYTVPESSLSLLGDDGNDAGPSGAVKLGKAATVRNSQCTARLVSAKGDGNIFTVVAELSFAAAFAGKKVLFLAYRDRAENNSGWLPLGTWEAQPPTPAKRKAPARKTPGRGKQ